MDDDEILCALIKSWVRDNWEFPSVFGASTMFYRIFEMDFNALVLFKGSRKRGEVKLLYFIDEALILFENILLTINYSISLKRTISFDILFPHINE